MDASLSPSPQECPVMTPDRKHLGGHKMVARCSAIPVIAICRGSATHKNIFVGVEERQQSCTTTTVNVQPHKMHKEYSYWNRLV